MSTVGAPGYAEHAFAFCSLNRCTCSHQLYTSRCLSKKRGAQDPVLAFSAEALRLCTQGALQTCSRTTRHNAAIGAHGTQRACWARRRPVLDDPSQHGIRCPWNCLLSRPKQTRASLLTSGPEPQGWRLVEHCWASDNSRATVLARLSMSSKPRAGPAGESISQGCKSRSPLPPGAPGWA